MALHLLPQADDEGNIGNPEQIWDDVRCYTIVFKDTTELSTEPSVAVATPDIVDKWSTVITSLPSPGNEQTVTHNQGKAPFTIVWSLICTNSELGFSVGDRLYPDWCTGHFNHQMTVWFEGVNRINNFHYALGDDGAGSFTVPTGSGHVHLDRYKWNLEFTLYFLT